MSWFLLEDYSSRRQIYLSSIGGGQALTPPKRHSLGSPLHYQLADTSQATPEAINLCSVESIKYYPIFRLVIPDSRVCTHVLLPRSPLCQRGALAAD